MRHDEHPPRSSATGETTPSGLPHRVSSRTHDKIVIAHHLILHAYGHWLPNDPRGSGSGELREEKLADLGPIHHGRKRVQPPRGELKRFYRDAEPLLGFPMLWFDDAKRQAIAESFARTVVERGYTVWGCAILRNHAHLCIRRHRDDAVTMWNRFAEASRRVLCSGANVPANHPIWSSRPYKVFWFTPDEVRRVVAYIENNPCKEGLPRQQWSFVKPYDGWPGAR